MQRMFVRLLPILLLPLAACTAVRAGVQLQDAMSARDAAEAKDASTNAPYEWTMASLYLDKAWEEMGSGAYRTCVQLARKSAEWSDHAVVQVERGKRTLEIDAEPLEQTSVAPRPDPRPPPEPEIEKPLESPDDLKIGPTPTPTPAPAPAPEAAP